ncbi:MAG: hypothetical protein OJF51_002143 [Nitrospira sp.]|nr:MAG: hypothetical protein OJF51_002143 [Nitrospira sp.]
MAQFFAAALTSHRLIIFTYQSSSHAIAGTAKPGISSVNLSDTFVYSG